MKFSIDCIISIKNEKFYFSEGYATQYYSWSTNYKREDNDNCIIFYLKNDIFSKNEIIENEIKYICLKNNLNIDNYKVILFYIDKKNVVFIGDERYKEIYKNNDYNILSYNEYIIKKMLE